MDVPLSLALAVAAAAVWDAAAADLERINRLALERLVGGVAENKGCVGLLVLLGGVHL